MASPITNPEAIAAAENDNLDLLKHFLREKDDVVDKNALSGITFLHAACTGHTTTCAEFLIRSGADIEASTWYEETPLHIAAVHGAWQNVLLLLQAGADVNAESKYSETPLHHAAESGCERCVSLLLQYRANRSAFAYPAGCNVTHDCAGYTAIDIAKMHGHHHLCNTLAYVSFPPPRRIANSSFTTSSASIFVKHSSLEDLQHPTDLRSTSPFADPDLQRITPSTPPTPTQIHEERPGRSAQQAVKVRDSHSLLQNW